MPLPEEVNILEGVDVLSTLIIGALIGAFLAGGAAVGLLSLIRSKHRCSNSSCPFRGRSVSDGGSGRTADARADAVKAFAESRAATKVDDGGAAGGGSQALPVAMVPWILGRILGKRIRLLIADDDPVVLSDLRETLESQPDFTVVGEATTGAEAVKLTDRLHPKVVLMNLHMTEVRGAATIAQIKDENPDTYVLAMTTQDSDDADILPLIETGASGYLLRDAPREELFEAIRATAQGIAAGSGCKCPLFEGTNVGSN